MTTESLSVTIEGELLTVEIGTVAAPAGGGGGGSGDVVGPASSTDGRIAEFDGITGKLLRQSSYTITTLLAAAWARASHTGTQLAATISDFASAAVAAVTWSTITGKPSTFDPSAHKTSHATGGGDALTAADIGAATAGHDHTGTYQPLATVLTNTTAAFTTAQETKLGGIEALADVTDAGNVGTAIDGATAKTTPVDADTVALIDSAAGNVLKKLSWANIKATAKTYFDTLYAVVGRTISASGLATGGGDLSANRTITVTASTAANVSTGTATDSALTPGALKDSTPYYVDRAADWTLALTDRNKDQWFNDGASALVCTIPLNATVAFAVGDTIPFVRLASGTATIDAATSVTLNGVSGGSCTISTRYQGALLKKIATDSWVVSGDVSAVA